MKNVLGKFLVCCSCRHDSRQDQAFECTSPEKKYSSLVSAEDLKKSENSMKSRRRPSRRIWFKLIKAVLIETILAKRVSKRGSLIRKSMDSSDRRHYIWGFKSNPALLSSKRVALMKPSEKLKDDDDNNIGGGGGTGTESWRLSSRRITMMLIILSVTVLCGRLYAIPCATVCFYYLPRQSECGGGRKMK